MGKTGDFRRGAEAAKAAQKSGAFARTDYFRIEDGDEAILRFISDAHDDPAYPHVDAWITVDQHGMVPTKPKPDGWESKWPKSMSAVCRYDPAFEGMYEDCYICDHMVDGERVRKPSARHYALAVEREKVFGDGSEELGGPDKKGKLVGVTDKTREVTIKKDDEEKTVVEKKIVVVNMGWKNFFNALDGFAGVHGTILDRDYWIKRQGASTDTTYQIVNMDPIPGFDLRDPDTLAQYESNYDLGEIVTELSSDEFYGKFFDQRYTVGKEGEVEKSSSDVPVEAQAKPEGDVPPEKLKAITDRVKGYKAESSGEEPEAEAESSEGLVNIG